MIVPRNVFEIAGLCEAGHRRYNLNAVEFSQSGGRCLAYATNATQLIAAEWEGHESDVEKMLVSRAACEKATNFWASPTDQLRLSPGSVSDAKGTAIACDPAEGKFPPCREAFFEPKDGINVWLDLRLLKQLVDVMVAMAKGCESVEVTLSIDHENPTSVLLTSSEKDPQSMGNVAGIIKTAGPDDGSLPDGPAWYPGMKEPEVEND